MAVAVQAQVEADAYQTWLQAAIRDVEKHKLRQPLDGPGPGGRGR